MGVTPSYKPCLAGNTSVERGGSGCIKKVQCRAMIFSQDSTTTYFNAIPLKMWRQIRKLETRGEWIASPTGTLRF